MAFALHLVPSPATPLRSPQGQTHGKVKPVQFARHDRIPTSHSAIWRIQSGYVRSLTWNLEGDPIPLGFWSAGDVVGEAIAQTSPYEVQCLSAVTAEALSSDYAFSFDAVMAQVQQSNDLLRIVHCRQMELRLLRFLCWLAYRFGQPTSEGLEVPIKLIHQDIADTMGSTRVTVTRLLKALERDGKLRWSGQEKVVYHSTLAQFSLDIDYQLKV